MNEKQQRTHTTALNELEAAMTVGLEALEDRLTILDSRVDNHSQWLRTLDNREQQGRDLFAKMLDDETQYRKMHVKMIRDAIMEGVGKFTTGLTFWQRFRWLFLGRAFPLPPAGGIAPVDASPTPYYGEKPR